MWMTVGKRRFAITLADTETARAFAEMLPLTIELADLNSNEKHADLPRSLPSNATQPGTIRNGDLMLYGSRNLGCLLSGLRLVLLLHATRPRGRSLWPFTGARPTWGADRFLQYLEIQLMKAIPLNFVRRSSPRLRENIKATARGGFGRRLRRRESPPGGPRATATRCAPPCTIAAAQRDWLFQTHIARVRRGGVFAKTWLQSNATPIRAQPAGTSAPPSHAGNLEALLRCSSSFRSDCDRSTMGAASPRRR